MKYMLFTDLHLGIHGNNSVWLEKSLALAEEIAEAARQNNIKKIIFGGDFFNDRRSLNTRTIDFAHKILEVFGDFELFMVIGNHDTYFKNSNEVHSLTMFKQYKNVKVVTENMWMNDEVNMALVSWGQPLPEEPVDILIGHFEINGCINAPDIHGAYETSDFSRYGMVLSGHFHTPTRVGNIQYLGSCMPFTFADVDSPRGYYILDTKKRELEFFEFKQAPKYVIVTAGEEVDGSKIEGNIVKIVFLQDLGTNEEEKEIALVQLHNPLYLHTEFKLTNVQEDVTPLEESSSELPRNIDIFYDYIDKIDTGRYNKQVLKGIVNSFLS